MRLTPFSIVPYALLIGSVGMIGAVSLAPMPDRPIAAVFPPWWSAEQSFRAAAQSGVPIIRYGALMTIVVLGSGDSETNRRLHDAGAWLLLDAKAVSGCSQRI